MIGLIRRIFQLLIQSNLITHGTYPRSASGAAAAAITLTAAAVAWTYGALYTVIVAATVADCQLEGVTLENFVGAASQGDVQIATGALGAETVIATVQATAGSYEFRPSTFIPAGTRLTAHYRTSTAVADSVDVKLRVIEGF